MHIAYVLKKRNSELYTFLFRQKLQRKTKNKMKIKEKKNNREYNHFYCSSLYCHFDHSFCFCFCSCLFIVNIRWCVSYTELKRISKVVCVCVCVRRIWLSVKPKAIYDETVCTIWKFIKYILSNPFNFNLTTISICIYRA